MEVIIDKREPDKFEHLFPEKYDVKWRQIPAADFIFRNKQKEVAFERKRKDDWKGSIINGKIFKQASKMQENFQNYYIMVVGDLFFDTDTENYTKNSVMGAIGSLQGRYGANVNTAPSEVDAVYLMRKIFQKTNKGKVTESITYKSVKSSDEIFKQIIMSMPNVGEKTCDKLLQRYDTIKEFVNCNQQQLQEIDGIGKTGAENIVKALNMELESVEGVKNVNEVQ